MASKYTKADKETLKIFKRVLSTHHEELTAVGVAFDILLGFAPENSEGEAVCAALKLHGYEANAITKIVGLKDRVLGQADAQIVLDGDLWTREEDPLSDEQKAAILDHEIYHIQVKRDHEGAVINDTHGRPKLKMRLHDRQIGWFDAVARRNGEHSVEVKQASLLAKEAGQIYFNFVTALEAPSPADPEA